MKKLRPLIWSVSAFLGAGLLYVYYQKGDSSHEMMSQMKHGEMDHAHMSHNMQSENEPPENVVDWGEWGEARFQDQNKAFVGAEDLKGQVSLLHLFFTSCHGPCPLMTGRLLLFQKKHPENG